MRKAKLSVCAVLMAAFAVLTMACGVFQASIQAGKDTITISQIGQVYRSYCTKNMKGPATADDLTKTATTPDENSAIQQIKDGKFTVVYNLNVNDPTVGNGTTILAYTATANNGVRVVLMADCVSIQSMQEADFQNKLKNNTPPTKGPVVPPGGPKDKPIVPKDK